MADLGVNAIIFEMLSPNRTLTQVLNKIQAKGLTGYALCTRGGPDIEALSAGDLTGYGAMVDEVKTHPALRGYLISDEADKTGSGGATGDELRKNRYEVKTLAFLEQHEVKDGAFAHLCKYTYEKRSVDASDGCEGFDFYRVCLQDNVILDAVDRAGSFVKLAPLMLYVAAHELIHVLRFGSGLSDFNAPAEEKELEEKLVHSLTRSALKLVRHTDLDIVSECFSGEFSLGDICN